MIALTLTQPWATLVVLNEKCNETRPWTTRVRGEVAIHAAKGFPKAARDICLEDPFFGVLMLRLRENVGGHGDPAVVLEEKLPLGAIVGVTSIADCFATSGLNLYPLSNQEQAFGDYSPGRFVFRLEKSRAIAAPVQARGMLGFWKVPTEVEAAVRAQL